MVQGTEVFIGARTDPQYGPFLMVGLGGIFVEVLKDVSIRLLPIDEREARETCSKSCAATKCSRVCAVKGRATSMRW